MSFAEYFIGAGNVHVSPLDANGDPTKWHDIKEVPVFEWNPNVEYADNFKTGKTGPNLQDLHVPIKRTAALMMTMKERTKENLENILHGVSTSANSGTMSTPVNLPSGIVANDVILVPGDHVGITNLVLKDSAGSPVTVDTADYSFDGSSKLITWIDVSGYTQPFKVFSYSFVASRSTTILSATPADIAVLFDGINLAIPGQKIWARFDRVSFGPSAKFSLKAGSASGTANEPDAYELSGVALLKPGNEQDDGYGVIRIY
jgi:hypothetical protein